MMSEQDSPGQEIQAAPTYIDRIGPALVAARENLALGAEDIANRLRLSLRQVQALENDDFAVLPEAVITRGFIRNYARLVNIDAAPLLRVYSQYVPVQDSQAISIPSANIVISGEAGMSWRPYVWFGVLLVVLLAGWVLYVDFFQKHDPSAGLPEAPVAGLLGNEGEAASERVVENPVSPDPVPPTSSEAPALPAQPAAPVPTQEIQPPAEASVPPVQPAPAPQAAPGDNTQSQPAAGDARLKFSVDEATWISIADGSGKQIVNKTLAANSEEVIAGRPPFRIVIGNTAGTKLEYNNQPVDLAPYTKVNVARLTLE